MKQIKVIPIEDRRKFYLYVCASHDLNISMQSVGKLIEMPLDDYCVSDICYSEYERMIIKYAKPFFKSEPKLMSRLCKEFADKWGDKNNDQHVSLLAQRNKQFAHGDLIARKAFVLGLNIEDSDFEEPIEKARVAVRSDYFNQETLEKGYLHICQLVAGFAGEATSISDSIFVDVEFSNEEVDLLC